jgi:thiol-disulfide isomerase/thioredoxin
MKRITNLLFLSFAFFAYQDCAAQDQQIVNTDSFHLKGNIIGRDSGYIILWYPGISGKWIRDTAYLNNGSFEFKGTIYEPSFAHLIGLPKDGNYADIYLEKGDQAVTLKENNFRSVKMSGSETQKQNDSLYKEIQTIETEYNGLYGEYQKLNLAFNNSNNSSFPIAAKGKLDEIKSSNQTFFSNFIYLVKVRFIEQHPDSYVSPTELLGIINSQSLIATEQLYNLLTPRIKKSRAGLLCSSEIAIRKKTSPGTTVSNFETKDIDGRPVSLSQFRGKYILLDFWASWCVPCLKTIPHLKELYGRYHNKGFQIVAISVDKNSRDWEEAVKKEKTYNWYNLLENKNIKELFKGIQVLPTQLLVDPAGKIIWNSTDDNSKSLDTVIEEQMTL